MSGYLYCCARGAVREHVFAEIDVPEPRAELALKREFVPLPAPYSTVVHEAAHAVASVAIGGAVKVVTVDSRNISIAANGKSRIGRGAVLMAGPFAENRLRRFRRTAATETVIELIDDAVADRCGRTCDECIVGRLFAFGPSDEDVAAGLAMYRRAEALALRMIDDPAFWAAVLEVAERLERDREASGADVHEIAGRHFVAGSFDPLTENQE